MTAGTDATSARIAASSGTVGVMDSASAGSPGAGAKNPINYDGHWSGTTSNGFYFGFDVIQATVDRLILNTISATAGCPTSSTGWMLGAGDIVNDGFMLDDPGTGIHLHGRFVSASNAKGDFALMQSGPIPCDSSGTWSATKQ
jgi:hypothetical protein